MKGASIMLTSLLLSTGRSAFFSSRMARRSFALGFAAFRPAFANVKAPPVARLVAVATMTAVACSCAATAAPCNHTQCQGFPEESLEFDTYNGVELRVEKLEGDNTQPHKFAQDLKSSLETWIDQGKRGIWIYIPTRMAHLVPPCIDNGFDFHFAKKGNVVLTRWLPDTPSRLPLGPTHQIGVGCFVVHPSDPTSMLVVQELTGPAAKYGLWKMPTGLLDPNEDIAQGAIREMKEETGLDGELDAIMCFRQAHPGGDRGSDLFFVCRMKLLSDIANIEMQKEEIAAIQWMKIDDYASQKLWQGSPLYEKMNQVMTTSSNHGFAEAKLEVGFRPGVQTIYLSKSNL